MIYCHWQPDVTLLQKTSVSRPVLSFWHMTQNIAIWHFIRNNKNFCDSCIAYFPIEYFEFTQKNLRKLHKISVNRLLIKWLKLSNRWGYLAQLDEKCKTWGQIKNKIFIFGVSVFVVIFWQQKYFEKYFPKFKRPAPLIVICAIKIRFFVGDFNSWIRLWCNQNNINYAERTHCMGAEYVFGEICGKS